MKKYVVIILALVVVQKWDAINAYINPPPDYAAMHDAGVILYATSWCGYCAKTRRFLDKHDIAYHEYDIEKSREGREQFEKLGGRGVPLLLVNGEVVKGYRPEKILEYLE